MLAYPSPNVPYGPVTIMPSAYNAQAVITGATTLHVMLVRSGSAATVTASPLRPKLWPSRSRHRSLMTTPGALQYVGRPPDSDATVAP